MAGRGLFSTDNHKMKKLRLLLPLSSLATVISGLQWTKVSEVIRTAISLSYLMIYIPAHLRIFPIRAFVHQVAIVVLTIPVRIFSPDDVPLFPNLVKALFTVICHSILLFVKPCVSEQYTSNSNYTGEMDSCFLPLDWIIGIHWDKWTLNPKTSATIHIARMA